MEFPESEEDSEVFKPNGHEPDLSVAPEPSSKVHPAEGKQSMNLDEVINDSDETDLIREIVEELSSAHRARRQTNRLAEQAASVVERYASQASTDAIYKESASRPAKHPNMGHPPGETADDSALIETMYKAASRANNERESGLQAALAVPLMIRQYPRVQRGLWAALPALSVGMNVLARFLHRAGVHRSLIMELPNVLRATLDRIAWYVSHRRVINSALVSTVLAEQIGIWLTARPRRSFNDGQSQSHHSGTDQPESAEE